MHFTFNYLSRLYISSTFQYFTSILNIKLIISSPFAIVFVLVLELVEVFVPFFVDINVLMLSTEDQNNFIIIRIYSNKTKKTSRESMKI